jgi:hypothetical protein
LDLLPQFDPESLVPQVVECFQVEADGVDRHYGKPW